MCVYILYMVTCNVHIYRQNTLMGKHPCNQLYIFKHIVYNNMHNTNFSAVIKNKRLLMKRQKFKLINLISNSDLNLRCFLPSLFVRSNVGVGWFIAQPLRLQ